MTPAGYENMAAEAKTGGVSAADYLKQIVKAQREKGERHLETRRMETAPANTVPGGAAEDAGKGQAEEQAIQANAAEIAEYAKAYRAAEGGGMY